MTDRRTDGQTDGRTDGGDCNIPDAFLKKRGDNKLHSYSLYTGCLYYIWKLFNINTANCGVMCAT